MIAREAGDNAGVNEASINYGIAKAEEGWNERVGNILDNMKLVQPYGS